MSPGWLQHAIWWRIYPLGFVDAFPERDSAAVPGEHRLLRIVEWLDHVVELGASGLALGPIFASSTHGYDTTDHLRLDPRLGEEADFDELIGHAHRRGLRVQLDGVFNHVGEHHDLVAAARAGALDDWFRIEPDGSLGTFEGHGSLIEFNHRSAAVREYVIRVMRHWLDRGADAWRLDAAYAVPTEFWADVLPEVRRTHPEVAFEAEVLHGDYAAFIADSSADTVTQYELWKATWSSLNDGNFFELDWALQRHNEMLAVFAPSTFIGNHDVTRIASRITDSRHLPHAVVLLAMLGGIPTVYAGDEFAFRGIKEDRFGGDDAIRPAFPVGGPAALIDADQGVRTLHQLLLGVRRRHPWLHRATSRPLLLTNTQYAVELTADGHSLRVGLNLDDDPLELTGAVVAADPVTAAEPSMIAPHGWAVLA